MLQPTDIRLPPRPPHLTWSGPGLLVPTCLTRRLLVDSFPPATEAQPRPSLLLASGTPPTPGISPSPPTSGFGETDLHSNPTSAVYLAPGVTQVRSPLKKPPFSSSARTGLSATHRTVERARGGSAMKTRQTPGSVPAEPSLSRASALTAAVPRTPHLAWRGHRPRA